MFSPSSYIHVILVVSKLIIIIIRWLDSGNRTVICYMWFDLLFIDPCFILYHYHTK